MTDGSSLGTDISGFSCKAQGVVLSTPVFPDGLQSVEPDWTASVNFWESNILMMEDPDEEEDEELFFLWQVSTLTSFVRESRKVIKSSSTDEAETLFSNDVGMLLNLCSIAFFSIVLLLVLACSQFMPQHQRILVPSLENNSSLLLD